MAINVTIDDVKTTAKPGDTILEVARTIGKDIPTLCHIEGLPPNGACRICVVEVAGKLVPACATPVNEGMQVRTGTPKVLEARKSVLELLLAAHPNECTTCFKADNCDLADLARVYAIERINIPQGYDKKMLDIANPAIIREPEKCILCGKCVRVCSEIQAVGAIDFAHRGADSIVAPTLDRSLVSTQCTFCGQCVLACPTGALHENPHIAQVQAALNDESKTVVVQTAPAVRVSIGELFGMEPGTVSTGRMVAGLRAIGFEKVIDTNFGADLTIMEEANELAERIKNDGPLPLLTSCSPGWVKFIEHNYPNMLQNVSTAKSPQQMTGAVIKHIWAEKEGIKPEDVYVVSVMPCTAKKYEANRPELAQGTISDVDAVLTTRETGMLMRQMGIDLARVPEVDFDHPMGTSSGAAAIFARSGGVMEAAIRTAYKLVTGEELEEIELHNLGGKGIREAEIDVGELKLKVATVSGLAAAKELMDRIQNGEKFHFVEVMACPGGCIAGGGQPYSDEETIELRKKAINVIDRNMPIRKSHQNPEILELYRDYLDKPLSEKSHKLLHTHYYKRQKYGS
ncbi:MAG: NADH-dependent [FeFe] hydrogenase, group A6 [Candidatus Zixiibacteriota bacterium]